jgi:fructose-1,6-bisphosphatase/inositol monophosphatase family enzyme
LLAAGHVDAVVDYDLQPYDYLALMVVIEEAGGVMTDWDGRPLNLKSDGRVLSAATPQLHAKLLAQVGG